jgi:hypothetical protein
MFTQNSFLRQGRGQEYCKHEPSPHFFILPAPSLRVLTQVGFAAMENCTFEEKKTEDGDGCNKAKLRVALQVLAELKNVLKQDAGLERNVSKTSVFPKGVTQQAAFDAA